MAKRVLLLGSSGKMGRAFNDVLKAKGYEVIGKNSKDFDAGDFKQVRKLIEKDRADIVINSVACLGIDPCGENPENALKINALYPRFLAELSLEFGFLLVHFSTDAVFNDEKSDFYVESDRPSPLNMYGLSKYGGDCFLSNIAKRYYIFRVSILFGETSKNNQFVEKMLGKIKEGQSNLRIADDIISSPTYSKDVASECLRIWEEKSAFGLYHIANAGKASLYELMREIVKNLKLEARVEQASYKDFPFTCLKNTNTPIASEKIPSLRPWQDAVKEYCSRIKGKI